VEGGEPMAKKQKKKSERRRTPLFALILKLIIIWRKP
jgi:hypothetical protein